MHEWHTNSSRNPLNLINEFMGFTFETDHSEWEKVQDVRITNRMFSTQEDAITNVTNSSYGGNTAYLAAYTTKKLTKGYQTAYNNFLEKYKEYRDFEKNFTISYGRTSEKATCPVCKSSINLKYGKKLKACPVCGSRKIISDSNWKALDTKRRMAVKAADNLSKEATKNDVTFVCGIEWHC